MIIQARVVPICKNEKGEEGVWITPDDWVPKEVMAKAVADSQNRGFEVTSNGIYSMLDIPDDVV